jgi:hypothetical protein
MLMSTRVKICVLGLLLSVGSVASAQRAHEPRWGLKVASVAPVADTATQVFEVEIQLTNNDFGPRDASEVQVRTFFDLPGFDAEFVNATYANVTTFDGAQTGVNGTVSFSGFGRLGVCEAIAGSKTNGNVFNFTTSPIIVPEGGLVTYIVTLQRVGGEFPFNVDGDSFTALDGNITLHEDRHFALFFSEPPGADTPACVWDAPLIPALQPLNPCSGEPFPCNVSF